MTSIVSWPELGHIIITQNQYHSHGLGLGRLILGLNHMLFYPLSKCATEASPRGVQTKTWRIFRKRRRIGCQATVAAVILPWFLYFMWKVKIK